MKLRLRLLLTFALLAVIVGAAAVVPRVVRAAAGPGTFTGTLDNAAYVIDVPPQWNGTLVLYSHGYVAPGQKNPAQDAGDPLTRQWLLSQGYALAGSAYSQTGWALQQAFQDQMDLLNLFTSMEGQPSRTIAWGHSLGGIITAGLIQLHPDRFSAALPMCGVVSGGVATWNVALDGAFAFGTLLGSGTPLQLVHITNPGGNLKLAEGLLAGAQNTPQGRARIALAAAIGDTPGWFDPSSPEPAPTDFTAQEANQFLWDSQVDYPFVFALRAELEVRAGGNPSWNIGVDYRTEFEHSADAEEVRALYQQAGLDLNADLDTLQNAPRIAADPAAVDYLNKYITFNGNLEMPVLTMHTTGDGLVINQDEQAYASIVRKEGNNDLLRQIYVHRAGHCAFTPAETITAFQSLISRLDTGQWGPLNVDDLNADATGLGSTLNTAPASFVVYHPTLYPRPYFADGN